MSAKQDLAFASDLLRECRTFIDNIVPGCAAGHDELLSLKWRIDLFYFEIESRVPNPAITAPPSAGSVNRVVGQCLNNEWNES